jgi:prepilin-type N-terminal cleavage/methylation domain-containing protein
MSDKKGFTLLELIVVMIIIGVLATVAVLNYNTMMIQGAASAAQNNLITIYAAQKNCYLSPVTGGSYCTSACNSLASINTTLALNISDNSFTYTCSTASGFTCTATNISDPNLYLTVTNAPIVLPGASGTLNPSCATNNNAYCPG